MTDNYNGYPLFNSTKNPALRTWNRCATFFSIYKDHGKEQAQAYVKLLDDFSRAQMNKMLAEIREKGYGTVRQSVVQSHNVH